MARPSLTFGYSYLIVSVLWIVRQHIAYERTHTHTHNYFVNIGKNVDIVIASR